MYGIYHTTLTEDLLCVFFVSLVPLAAGHT